MAVNLGQNLLRSVADLQLPLMIISTGNILPAPLLPSIAVKWLLDVLVLALCLVSVDVRSGGISFSISISYSTHFLLHN
jgi:hypothetical protein